MSINFEIPNTPEELSAFYKASLFRLVIGIWAVVSLIVEPFTKALITLIILGLVLLLGETVLSSIRLHAKFKAMRRVAMEAEAERRQAAIELEKARAAAAEKYFDLEDKNLTTVRKELDLDVPPELDPSEKPVSTPPSP